MDVLLLFQSLSLVAFAWFHRTNLLRLAVLRSQLAVYKRSVNRPILNNRNRLFWVVTSRVWKDWRSELLNRALSHREPEFLPGAGQQVGEIEPDGVFAEHGRHVDLPASELIAESTPRGFSC